MTKNVSLSFVVCFPRKRGHSQREKALSWERKQFLYPWARVYLKRPHTQRHLERLSLFSPSKTREKTLSLSLSLEKRRRIFSVSWLLALSRSLSRTFSSISKKFYHTHALLSYSLSHTHTNSFVKMRRWYTTALLFAHSSELFVRTKKERERKEHSLVVLIFVWKHRIDDRSKGRKKLPLARNETKKQKKRKKSKKIFITPLASLIVDLITLFFLARVWSRNSTRKHIVKEWRRFWRRKTTSAKTPTMRRARSRFSSNSSQNRTTRSIKTWLGFKFETRGRNI